MNIQKGAVVVSNNDINIYFGQCEVKQMHIVHFCTSSCWLYWGMERSQLAWRNRVGAWCESRLSIHTETTMASCLVDNSGTLCTLMMGGGENSSLSHPIIFYVFESMLRGTSEGEMCLPQHRASMSDLGLKKPLVAQKKFQLVRGQTLSPCNTTKLSEFHCLIVWST